MTQYQRSIVSYLDVLGFREIIAARRDAGWIADLLRRFTATSTNMPVADWYGGAPHKPHTLFQPTRATTFSDLAVRVTPVPADVTLGFLVADEADCISWIQAGLVYLGVLLRGSVTVGDLYLGEGIVFGPALVRAYELEATLAQFPRVIIDPMLYEDVRRESETTTSAAGPLLGMRALDGMFRLDADGMCFVDYFSRIMGNDLRYRDVGFAEAHRDLTCSGLKDSAGAGSRLGKYEWLRSYHNRVIQEIGDRSLERAGSSVQALALES